MFAGASDAPPESKKTSRSIQAHQGTPESRFSWIWSGPPCVGPFEFWRPHVLASTIALALLRLLVLRTPPLVR